MKGWLMRIKSRFLPASERETRAEAAQLREEASQERVDALRRREELERRVRRAEMTAEFELRRERHHHP